jgi:predicted Fe-Mo cluster-binding NifX family protein
MIIALPLTDDGTFSTHFGASAKAALFEVDPDRRHITCSGVFTPPGLAPCGWAPWLRHLGVDRLLAHGMGRGAQERMAECGIEVVAGVEPGNLDSVVRAWLDGTLAVGANACEGGHGEGEGGCHHHRHGDGHEHGHGHGEGCGCAG